MRIGVEASQDSGLEIPRTIRLNRNRVEVVEVLDQWYGSDYRYCKVKGGEGAIYILRLDERRSVRSAGCGGGLCALTSTGGCASYTCRSAAVTFGRGTLMSLPRPLNERLSLTEPSGALASCA